MMRDVLDKLVVDRLGHEMGRVDGIRLVRQEGQRLQFASILMGPPVLEERLPPLLGRAISRLRQVIGLHVGAVVEIDASKIKTIDREIAIDAALADVGAARMETQLRAAFRRVRGRR